MFRQLQLQLHLPLVPYPVRNLCWSALCPMAYLEEPSLPTKPDVPLRYFQIVVAATRDLGIGQSGHLPWRLPSDLKFFKDVTSSTISSCTKNAIIMGRHTWESLPPPVRPLPGRINVVLSKSLSKEKNLEHGAIVSDSLLEALAILAAPPLASLVESVFVIGGGQVFREAMSSSFCQAIHLTEIQTSFNCDTFFPKIDSQCFRPWYASSPTVENGIRYCFTSYLRRESKSSCDFGTEAAAGERVLPRQILLKHEEYQYLNLVKDIIDTGVSKGDRTGVGTISKFGAQMRFNLRKSFPLLTTKRVFWRGVVEELLWLISGSTDARVLQRKGINIWTSNASREYLDSVGLHNQEEGDLGPVYGFQWRHFGAKYTDMHEDYGGKGFDQLADVVHKIRSTPDDRRIVLSAWNPADLQLMALPPCHMFAQFYVAHGELSCQMYQRSCDMGLGVPFNIASYALLTCLLAHVCDLSPGDFIHVLGDAHVYSNHVRPLQAQLQNAPKPFPCLKIANHKKCIDSFQLGDISLIDYKPCESIYMKMAI